MIGAVIIVLVLLFLMPFLFFMSGAVVAAIMGWALKADAEHRHQGSELINLNN